MEKLGGGVKVISKEPNFRKQDDPLPTLSCPERFRGISVPETEDPDGILLVAKKNHNT